MCCLPTDDSINLERETEMEIVAFSGGKDSTAMLFRMIELKMPIDRVVFANTTLEFSEMYSFIKKVNQRLKEQIGIEITEVRPKKRWEDMFWGKVTRGKRKGLTRGWPLAAFHGWCCRDFKVLPQRDFAPNKGNTVYLGIAADEGRTQKETGFRYPLKEWGWTEKDCLEYTKKIDLYNPLYDDFRRTGCWLCPKQPIRSLRVLYTKYPNLWKYLSDLETKSGMPFHPDHSIAQLTARFREEQKIS